MAFYRVSLPLICGLALAALLALLLWPEPARAAYPCPGGPGPGEVQVGVSGGSHGVAAVPVCERAGGGAPQEVTYYNIYGAIAAHPLVDDVWMAGNYTGAYAAENEAMAMCRAAMGDGCISFGEWHNSSYSVIRDRQGNLHGAWNGEGGAMRKKLLKDCAAQQLLPCEVLGSFSSSKRRHQPDLSVARKSYIAAAWVTGTDGYDSRLYIASGLADQAAAGQAAIAACTKATGHDCELLALGGNGVLQTYRIGASDQSATFESNAKRAQQAAKAQCKKRNQACTMQTAYVSRSPGMFVHDFIAGVVK